MGHRPITQQRSEWVRVSTGDMVPGVPMTVWQRNVHDGHLTVIVVPAEPGVGWHLSISHRTNTNPPRPGRYPTWDEIVHARDRMLPADLDFVMYLPAAGDFVSLHDTTFHLHEHTPS